MKILLAALLALPLAATVDRAGREVPPDDPPLDCPFCGGNVQLHAQVVVQLTATQARIALVALDAFRR